MSKKKTTRQKKRTVGQLSKRSIYVSIATLGLITILGLGTVAGPWRNSSGAKKLRALFAAPAPVPPVPPSNNPSKEYIYAGGKLIATEAPVTLVAPANVAALTVSDAAIAPTPKVTISWESTAGADHYQVERTANLSVAYAPIDSNVMTTTFTDTSVSSVTAYLYRVRAVDAVGNLSPPSNIDLATAISFTDDTLVIHDTIIRAAHINELRQAIDAVRATANRSTANWGGSVVAGSTEIQATHIRDMRTNLDEARSALGLSQCFYTETTLEALRASLIKKDHIDQLRTCVR